MMIIRACKKKCKNFLRKFCINLPVGNLSRTKVYSLDKKLCAVCIRKLCSVFYRREYLGTARSDKETDKDKKKRLTVILL